MKTLARPELRKLAANTGWILGERLLRLVLGTVTLAVVARHLGPSDYGRLQYVVALLLLFTELGGLGLSGVVVHELVRTPEREEDILGTTLGLKLCGLLVSCTLGVLTTVLLNPQDGTLLALAVILAVGGLFRSLETLSVWFESRVMSRVWSTASVVGVVVAALARVALVAAGASLALFGVATAAEVVVTGIVAAWLYFRGKWRVGTWQFDRDLARRLLGRSWPLILSGLGLVINLKIDQVMLGELSTERAVGVYAAAAQISEAFYFIPLALATSAFPSLVRVHRSDPARYRLRLQQLFDVTALGAWTIVVVVQLLAPALIHIVYGEAYAESATILRLHVCAAVFIFMRAILSKWLIVEDLLKFSLITHGLGAIANIGLNFVLIPQFGGSGAAVSTVVSYAVASMGALLVSRRTRPIFGMMALALLIPLRLPGYAVRRARRP